MTLTPEAMFAAIEVEAEKGHPQAMLNLGTMFEQGLGVPKNFPRALEWFGKAAEAGAAEGYLRLGR